MSTGCSWLSVTHEMKNALDVFWNKHSHVWVLVQSVHNEYMHSWCFITRLLSPVVITVAAPTVWNSLPAHLRSTLISRRQFRDGLKSRLFADAYFWSSENIRYKSVMYLLTYLLTELLLLPLLDICGCQCCSCCCLFFNHFLNCPIDLCSFISLSSKPHLYPTHVRLPLAINLGYVEHAYIEISVICLSGPPVWTALRWSTRL